MTLLAGALLGIMEESGESILTLTEGLEPDEFFASRLTRHEVLRLLRVMTETAANVPNDLKQQMAEIEWSGWAVLDTQLKVAGGFERDAIWFAIRSMVPATLMWLRVFRRNAPQLFSLAT
ncbi:hypothetical protein MTYP_00192 [Methylophilaceae bacterium]|nr:hypothetical protein MTYP_00192 [Methylophilaceae bacterium]